MTKWTDARKGDFEGHPFRGNQWTDGEGGGSGSATLSTGEAITGDIKKDIRLAEDGKAEDVQLVLNAHKAEKVRLGEASVYVTKDGVVTWDGEDEFASAYSKEEFMNEQVMAKVEDYADLAAMEEKFNSDFWEGPGTLYHVTTLGNVEAIKEEGLEARSDSRGFNNREVSASVFTTQDIEETDSLLSSYGGSIIEIDTASMKADGLTPFVLQEPDVLEREAAESIANKIGLELWEYYVEDAGSPNTVIVSASIPPKYITFIEEKTISFGVVKGDFEGHPFRGNQWTDGEGDSGLLFKPLPQWEDA